jgi:WD40 repeat protein
MSSGNEAGARRRALLAAGTASYDCPEFPDLSRVPDSLHTIVEILNEFGFAAVARAPGYWLDPDRVSMRAAVRTAAAAAPVVVVYYTGHGSELEGGTYYLVGKTSRAADLSDSAIAARDLLELLIRRDERGGPLSNQPKVLVILDCCFSGSAGMTVLREALNGIGNPHTWVIATAGPLEYAEQGVFAQAFRDALKRPRTGPSQPFISLDSLVQAVNDAHASRYGQRARVFSPPTGSTGIPPFFPNKDFSPGLAGLTVDEQHWLSRARGGPEGSPIGSYLTGREGRILAAEHLTTWMTDPGARGLAVVTGSPGTGKSTLLSLPVLLTHQARREDLLRTAGSGSLARRTADLLPVDTPLVALHARGLNTDQAAGVIAQALGRGARTAASLVEDLDDTLTGNSRMVIVVDAADEATSPDILLGGLVLPLARQPGLLVVVGARRHILTGAVDADLTIDLDTNQYKDPLALTDYIYRLLIAAEEPGVVTPYQSVPGQDARDEAAEVAAAIAQRATARQGGPESFLLGRLLALSARGCAERVDITSENWQMELPASVAEAFDQDLARLGGKQSLARTLLTTLAWAKGAGLPWENIWTPAARAIGQLNGETGYSLISDDDIRWLLGKAGAYIVEGIGPGQRSVYRPFHDLLATYLQGEPGVVTVTEREERCSRTEATITQALIETVPTGPQGHPDWLAAHPYLTTYLAQHAAATGTEMLAELAQDMDFLAVADPVTLTPLLSPNIPELREVAHIYRRAQPLLGGNASANAAYLAEARRALTGANAPFQSGGIQPLYRTHLASVRKDDSLLTITAYAGAVESVAFGVTADGRLLLASGGQDGTVRLWDPVTGTAIGRPLTGHTSTMESVAFGTAADGRLLLASGGQDSTVRLWDPVTGTAIGRPLTGHTQSVESVAFGVTADGRLLLASGGQDGTVRLWDPVTGTAIGRPLTGHTSTMESVAFGTAADGRLLLASGGRDGTLGLWDPVTGRVLGKPLTGHTQPVESVAFGTTEAGRLVLASGGRDGTIRLWDPATGKALSKPFTGHTSTVQSVAFGTAADGRLLLASGGRDGTVRLWRPVAGKALGRPLTGHAQPVESVAFGTTEAGRLVLASADRDRTVRLWDPAAGTTVGKPLARAIPGADSVALVTMEAGRLMLAWGHRKGTVWLANPVTGVLGYRLAGHTQPVDSVAFGIAADGRLVLASGGQDGTIRLWSPVTGTALSEPLTGHTGTVKSVAFVTAADGRLVLASGGQDGTIRLWNPATGKALGKPLTGHTSAVKSVAFVTTADGRLVLASGGQDGTIRLWNPATGKALGKPLTGHTSAVESVAFVTTADGRLVLASGGQDRTVRLWDVARKVCILALHRRSGVQSVALSGKLLAIGDQEGVSIIEPDLEGREFDVQAVAATLLRDFSPLEPPGLGDQAESSLAGPTSSPTDAVLARSGPASGDRTVPPHHTAVWIRINGTWCKGRITAWIPSHGKSRFECQIQAEQPAEHPLWSGRYVYDPRAIRPRHSDHPPAT